MDSLSAILSRLTTTLVDSSATDSVSKGMAPQADPYVLPPVIKSQNVATSPEHVLAPKSEKTASVMELHKPVKVEDTPNIAAEKKDAESANKDIKTYVTYGLLLSGCGTVAVSAVLWLAGFSVAWPLVAGFSAIFLGIFLYVVLFGKTQVSAQGAKK